MDLKITEEWVKKRVNLEDENPGDVKALALPGSYHEKIASLGTSLSNFSRLKQLDLSKNSIVTLEGLEHLKYLEELNLYYNQIPDLKEVFRLRKNQALREVDLRLNPVTKTEPDYRLFVVHMLPILRKLDDRSVRDTERKAALMHFTSDDALEMTDKPHQADNHQHQQQHESRQPRAEYVTNMVRKPTVVTDNDKCTDVIDEMTKPRGLTGSKIKEPYSTKHPHDEMLKLSEDAMSKHTQSLAPKHSTTSISKKTAPMRSQMSNGHDPDEELAYDKYTSVANFTPHTGAASQTPPTVYHGLSTNHEKHETNGDLSDTNNSLPDVRRLSFGDSMDERVASRQTQVQAQSDFVDDFLDLVDKYWNGSKSLHYHKKFRSLIQKPLDHFVETLSCATDTKVKFYQQKVATLEKDNHDLHARAHAIAKQQHGIDHKDAEISHLHSELESTRSRLQNSMNENKKMRGKIKSLEDKLLTEQDSRSSHNNEHEMELERQKRTLVQQVAQLKIQVKNYESLDQLAKMLQESHKSLMTTNERLVNELEETRSRHLVEIEQLKWSYDQLKKTNSLINGTTQHTNGYS